MNVITVIKTEILDPLIALLFAAAVVYFVYGAAMFVRAQKAEKGQEEGRSHLMWGIIGIFIMVAVYGIINLIANTVGYQKPY